MLMSILAFIKLKNISTTHRLERNHVIQHQNLVAALAEKVNKTKTNAEPNIRHSNPTPAGIKYLY